MEVNIIKLYIIYDKLSKDVQTKNINNLYKFPENFKFIYEYLSIKLIYLLNMQILDN